MAGQDLGLLYIPLFYKYFFISEAIFTVRKVLQIDRLKFNNEELFNQINIILQKFWIEQKYIYSYTH